MILVTGMLVAAPAQAAPSACNPGLGCTYEDANYGRGHINFSYNVPYFGEVAYWVPTLHPATNDSASSAFNNGTTGQAVRLFDRERYQGTHTALAKGKGISNLGTKSLNDKVSSACFANYCK